MNTVFYLPCFHTEKVIYSTDCLVHSFFSFQFLENFHINT